VFWDVFGEAGHPVRATVSDMGPLLLARLLNLNDTQAGVLQLVFKIADDQGLLIIDLKDLRATSSTWATTPRSSPPVRQHLRRLHRRHPARPAGIETQGGDKFFGEPMLDIADLMQTDADGRGVINILAADKLYNSPSCTPPSCCGCSPSSSSSCRRWATWTSPSWCSSSTRPTCSSTTPQGPAREDRAGGAPDPLKGVGVYFVTQNPLDVPETVLGQLGNRVQHALRAFTPRDQKAVKTAAETMRANPEFDAATVITELGVGEALISFLDEKAAPTSSSAPPSSPPTPASARSPRRTQGRHRRLGDLRALRGSGGPGIGLREAPGRWRPGAGRQRRPAAAAARRERRRPARRPQQHPLRQHRPPRRASPRPGRNRGRSVVRTVGSSIGREIVRGVLGSILGGGSRR
jgi:hypothetical protein